tara:strand:+ start:1123 stop:1437 length:315 start_codon:yes stop_codon:yes gene_type:complete
MNITTNIYGEIQDKNHYEKIEDIFNRKELKTDEEKYLISNKIRCACGLILSVSGLKAHVSSSAIHKKRMNNLGCADIYTHPYKPYSRIDKCIKIYNEKIVLNFD